MVIASENFNYLLVLWPAILFIGTPIIFLIRKYNCNSSKPSFMFSDETNNYQKMFPLPSSHHIFNWYTSISKKSNIPFIMIAPTHENCFQCSNFLIYYPGVPESNLKGSSSRPELL